MTDSPLPEPDPRDVLSALGVTPAGPCDRVSGGWDTLIWRFPTDDGRFHALRLYRGSGEGDRDAAVRERAAMQAAAAGGLPVPSLDAHGEFEGRPAFVLEWMAGQTLFDLAKAKPWSLPVLARAMGRTQAQLHRLPPPEGLPRLDPPWLARNIEHPGLRDAMIAEARADTFCHLDYHPLNVMGRGREVTGVLDWTNAAITDARVDLAFTHTALLELPLPRGPLNLAFQQVRRLFYRYWRQGYEAEAGSFPLGPLWKALGIYRYCGEVETAVREGRGWATEESLAKLCEVRDRRLAEAGLAP
jgi:aminoglycoside phosphotransferase (APT) family kinase protein